MKRKYPLFITDLSRSHGRAVETDYISCTSRELPFVAEVTYISENQYLREYDRENPLIIYDNGHNDCRIRMEVVEIREDFDPAQLRGLLTRAMKEFVTRRLVTASVDVPDSFVDKHNFIEELIKQGQEQKRKSPGNKIVDYSLGILQSIKEDYERGIRYTAEDWSADC